MRLDTRSAVLLAGVVFCAGFAVLTIYYAATADLTLGTIILLVVSLGINLMILLGLVGAIRNPPND